MTADQPSHAVTPIMHIAGATLTVVDEQLITCERVRTVNGKIEHYSFQYMAVTVREISA